MLGGLDLSGKVFVTTGADGNIAAQANEALAQANATVLLACRSASKCEATKTEIESATGGNVGRVETGTIDLSSKASIRAFASDVASRFPDGVNALVNSAGTYSLAMTHDDIVLAMEVNLLGPALLTDLMLPLLRSGAAKPPGRVVNVAAATYGFSLDGFSISDLAGWCKAVDPVLNSTGSYFSASKLLMIHHALELASREREVAAFAVNPGYALEVPGVPQGLLKHVPQWIYKLLDPAGGPATRIRRACSENERGLAGCPQAYGAAAAVVVTAAAVPGIEAHSGSYLDFDTTVLPQDQAGVFGPFEQRDPSCVPREAPPMDAKLQSDWYDEMLRIMADSDIRVSGTDTGATTIVV